MDTLYLSLIKTCKEMISSHTDTINIYESGEEVPEELYSMAKESLPKWKEQLSNIENAWPCEDK